MILYITVPTRADDNTDSSVQFREATSVPVRTSKMNVSSPEDAVESKPVKKEEETDPSEMPIQDARIPNNQVQQNVIKEEFNDGLSMMVNTGLYPAASSKANSSSEKMNKMVANSYKPVKVEQCASGRDSLSLVGKTSRDVLADGNGSPNENTSKKLKPAPSILRVKKEELNDNLSTIVHVDDLPPPSARESRSFEKKTMKRKVNRLMSTEAASHSTGLQPSTKPHSQQMDKVANAGYNSSVFASQSVDVINTLSSDDGPFLGKAEHIDATRRSMMDSSIKRKSSRNETTDKLPLQVTKTAAVAHQIVKKEEFDDNLSTVVNFDREPLISYKLSFVHEKDKNKKSDLHGSHSRVANESFVVPSGVTNLKSTDKATPMASNSSCKISESCEIEMNCTNLLDEVGDSQEDGISGKMLDAANETSGSESDCSVRSVEDFDPSDKRRRRFSIWESDPEPDSAASDEDAHDDDNSVESGKMNENTSVIVHEDLSSKGELKCLECLAVFKTNDEFQQHIRSHKGYRRFQCDTCQKRFTCSYSLQIHKLIHTGARPFKCRICEKSFNQSGNLRIHELIHTGALPHKCVICEKGFKTNKELLIHERVHTGARPYKCSTCGKRFSNQCNLRTHIRIHTGDKPYICPTCGNSFNQSTHLKTHIRIHTGEKPYKCTSCEKRFATSSNLRSHEKSHKVINSDDLPDVQQQPMDQSSSIELTAVPGGAVTEQKIHYGSKNIEDVVERMTNKKPNVLHLVWSKKFSMELAKAVARSGPNCFLIVQKCTSAAFSDVFKFSHRMETCKINIDQDANSLCLFSFGELNLPPKILRKPNIKSLGKLETKLKKFAHSQGMEIVNVLKHSENKKGWYESLRSDLKEEIYITNRV